MITRRQSTLVRRGAASVAVAFGALTLLAGGRILLGVGEAGYAVLRPVLVFNTLMGAAYVVTGLALWRDAWWARMAAIAIATANLGVLLLLALRIAGNGVVAGETMAAMTLRALVWLVLAAIVTATSHGRGAPTPAP